MSIPMPLETRIMREVSLSSRNRKITAWKNKLTKTDRIERPSIDCRLLQKEISASPFHGGLNNTR